MYHIANKNVMTGEREIVPIIMATGKLNCVHKVARLMQVKYLM